MKNSFVSILDLPEEILLNILNKLHNLDILYSLIGTNRKLDRIACDQTFTQSIDLTSILSNEKDNSKTNAIFDRFCSKILPRIANNIQCLTIETCFLEGILYANKFVNLHRVILINLDVNIASNIFNETSPFIINFKYQISELVLVIDYENHVKNSPMFTLLIDIYHRIFDLLSNLKYLDLDVNNNYLLSKSLLSDLSSTTCSSSTITHLCIKLHNIDDCFCLLDGRLNQLHTFIVKLEYTHDPSLLRRTPSEITQKSLALLNNTKNVDKLKYFSLFVELSTSEFDSFIVPLLRRMLYLEKLTLSLRLSQRTSFIDGIYLENSFLKQIPYLQRFIFDIVVDHVIMNEDIKPSFDDIQRTFIQRGYNVDGYMDCTNYLDRIWNRCHVYSLPSLMENLQPISHSFPGGLFKNVIVLWMRDEYQSFEHSFFIKISQSFPLLRRLTITNQIEQKQKSKEVSSIIGFSHLIELDCHAHINYVEQFLSNLNTYLPSLIKLHVRYEHLLTITQNFTRNATRTNCATLKSIKFDNELIMIDVIPQSRLIYQYKKERLECF